MFPAIWPVASYCPTKLSQTLPRLLSHCLQIISYRQERASLLVLTCLNFSILQKMLLHSSPWAPWTCWWRWEHSTQACEVGRWWKNSRWCLKKMNFDLGAVHKLRSSILRFLDSSFCNNYALAWHKGQWLVFFKLARLLKIWYTVVIWILDSMKLTQYWCLV